LGMTGCGFFAAIIVAGFCACAVRAEDRSGETFFETRIRPVLVDRCYECHSAGAKKLKGGLYLDSPAGIRKGGTDGAIFVAGDPDRSAIIKALRWKDKDLQMPPKQALAASQVADFEAWVKMGAPLPPGGDS